MCNSITTIPTFIINLKKRDDRKAHTLNEFKGRDEFALNIVEALENSNGALGLWSTFRHILLDRMTGNEDFVLIGEDDIEFTEHYSKDYLFNAIEEARQKNADVLLGGISWFSEAVQISDNLYWADSFTGTHFTIIFKKFYQALINTPFRNTSADFKMVALSRDILFMSPFVAVQRDFGYSDATTKNNVEGRVEQLFKSTASRLSILNAVKGGHQTICSERATIGGEEPATTENILLPTYVIGPPHLAAEGSVLYDQFDEKPEFDLNFITPAKHRSENMSFWLTLRQIVTKAIADDDDAIVVCTENHRFTEHYNKNYLLENIIDAHEEGADLLFGGVNKFYNAVPLNSNRCWVSNCSPVLFMVVYSKFFPVVLNETLDEKLAEKNLLPYNTAALCKMLIYPFVSKEAEEITSKADSRDVAKSNPVAINETYKLKTILQIPAKYSALSSVEQTLTVT